MRNSRGSGRGLFGQGVRHGSASFRCVCPQCGYSTWHIQGIPCSSLRCPTCDIPLMREDQVKLNPSNSTTPSIQPKVSEKTIHKAFPQVDTDLCTGCQSCLSSCPTKAIKMMDGKAFIVEDLCRNCRKCVRVCPVGAIS